MYLTGFIISKFKNIAKVIYLAVGVACLLPTSALTNERQYKVEAALLYSFFNYITWPGYDSPGELSNPLVCIYETDPILPYLEYMRRKMSKERALLIRTITEDEETKGCNLLFIRHTASNMEVSPSTLIVLKPDDPLDRGGMVELTQEGERITIKINQNLLEDKGFQTSSRLLDLAGRAR